MASPQQILNVHTKKVLAKSMTDMIPDQFFLAILLAFSKATTNLPEMWNANENGDFPISFISLNQFLVFVNHSEGSAATASACTRDAKYCRRGCKRLGRDRRASPAAVSDLNRL
jgi:hypothetical protein